MQPLLLLLHSFGVLVPLLGWGGVGAGIVGTYAAITGLAEAAGSAALDRELGLLAPPPLFPHFCLLYASHFTHTQMHRCVDLSLVLVC